MSDNYFDCNICGKKFKYFCLLEKHKKRKNPCKVSVNLGSDDTDISLNNPQIDKLCNVLVNSFNDMQKKELKRKRKEEENIENETYKCVYCNNDFTTKRGLTRHHNEIRCEYMPFSKAKNIADNSKSELTKNNYKKYLNDIYFKISNEIKIYKKKK